MHKDLVNQSNTPSALSKVQNILTHPNSLQTITFELYYPPFSANHLYFLHKPEVQLLSTRKISHFILLRPFTGKELCRSFHSKIPCKCTYEYIQPTYTTKSNTKHSFLKLPNSFHKTYDVIKPKICHQFYYPYGKERI